jgi:hypothetical protein
MEQLLKVFLLMCLGLVIRGPILRISLLTNSQCLGDYRLTVGCVLALDRVFDGKDVFAS